MNIRHQNNTYAQGGNTNAWYKQLTWILYTRPHIANHNHCLYSRMGSPILLLCFTLGSRPNTRSNTSLNNYIWHMKDYFVMKIETAKSNEAIQWPMCTYGLHVHSCRSTAKHQWCVHSFCKFPGLFGDGLLLLWRVFG